MAAALQRAMCIVTGGASGLGRATVQRLAQNGARVVIADLPSSDGENVAKELGESCCFAPTDVSKVVFRIRLFNSMSVTLSLSLTESAGTVTSIDLFWPFLLY